MRVRLEQERYMHRRFGLGVFCQGGSIGSTWGDPSLNYHWELTCVAVAWTFTLHVSWKAKAKGAL